MSDQARLLAAYLETVWTIPSIGATVTIGAPSEGLLNQVQARHAAIITACNPCSVELSDAENSERNDRLAADISAMACRAVPCVGRDSTETGWSEESLLVLDMPFDKAVQLGARHEQNAIVWIDTTEASLVVTANGFAGHPAGTSVRVAHQSTNNVTGHSSNSRMDR